jgi:hypothetical protein
MKMKQMTLNEQKNEIIESIAKALDRTSSWRKSPTARFPDDPRNARAEAKLNKLAADVANSTDAQFEELQKYFGYGWESLTWRDGLNQTARQVSFAFRAGDLDFFVRVLVQNLSLSSSIAA